MSLLPQQFTASSFDAFDRIIGYLSSQHVLSLCCQSKFDFWCASCFYLFEPNTLSFLLVSEHHTRHTQIMVENPYVAGSVSEQTEEVAKIRGVQFVGKITKLEGSEEQAARAHYNKRFPIAAGLPAPIWRVALDEVKLTDNSAGFGSKFTLERKEPEDRNVSC